ncbi:hypothetical protein AGOR_G00013550 [Albula goreensis]|uniref:C-C motif chemokine n=1 Tax=Albula goreensis TaxID=1534307 RepID=A0A8T3EAQ3_9TELE|nr:hypothetical protein AGOR_G00013550 [Albula goreensis]
MHQHRHCVTMSTGISLCIWVFLLYSCSSGAWGELALDCCLKVSHTEIPARIVRGFQRQVRGSGCDISAVVFITKKNLNLCAPPGTPWVENLINNLEKEYKKCQQVKFKRGRCKSLRM